MFLRHRPDVTLMDLQMPQMNGIEATIEIRRASPMARVLVLTTYSGDIQAMRALEAGAAGYLLKGSMHKELVQAIRDVHGGRRRIPPEVAHEMAENIGADRLSAREIEVLRVAAGQPNKLVADSLRITEDTVKGHMKSIMAKLQANDRTHSCTAPTWVRTRRKQTPYPSPPICCRNCIRTMRGDVRLWRSCCSRIKCSDGR
jgi:DNA-binding NarL/FixJ family response regulator